MDGTHREVIASFDVKWPNGLTLDLVSKKLYWVDAKLHTVSSCNFDGSQRRLVLFSPDWLPHPFSISTFEDSLYWSDWSQKAIIKANKFNGSNVTTVTALHMVSAREPVGIGDWNRSRSLCPVSTFVGGKALLPDCGEARLEGINACRERNRNARVRQNKYTLVIVIIVYYLQSMLLGA